MLKSAANPYRTPGEIKDMVDRHSDLPPVVHPQRVIEGLRRELPAVGRLNAWLADHVVAVVGTMLFFYFLCALMAFWVTWQSGLQGDGGFDPFPYSFLFFLLGGVMQSLFVPTMLTTANRAALRDQIKDETDHRAWSHLYAVNERQLQLIELIARRGLGADYPEPPASATAP